jgi:hypothetical protein
MHCPTNDSPVVFDSQEAVPGDECACAAGGCRVTATFSAAGASFTPEDVDRGRYDDGGVNELISINHLAGECGGDGCVFPPATYRNFGTPSSSISRP